MILAVDYKSYSVSCEKCDITEDMIFIRRKGSLGYRYLNISNAEIKCGKIIEAKAVFKPRRGFFNDKPPGKCPRCGGPLKRMPGMMIQS